MGGHPEINRIQMLGQYQIVVTQKNGVVANLGTLNETHPLLHHLLAGFVSWMRLAGNHQLNRSLTIGQDGKSGARDRSAPGSAAYRSRKRGANPRVSVPGSKTLRAVSGSAPRRANSCARRSRT